MATSTENARRPSGKTPESELSRVSIPRLRTTVAVLQDYGDPEKFAVVDLTLFLRLCKLDRPAHQIVALIDGRNSIQEIMDKASILGKTLRTRQEELEFFRVLYERQVLEF